MTQPTLFDDLYREPLVDNSARRAAEAAAREGERAKAPSRTSDPESSHEAGESMSRGAAHAQAEKCADLVFMKPGSTAAELAKLSAKVHGIDSLSDVQIRKRLPYIDSIKPGPQRKCTVAGTKQQTWEPA